MANTIPSLYYSNTFGQLLTTTQNLSSEMNSLGFGDWDKTSGQFSISSPDTGFLAETKSVFRGETIVEGVGSSLSVVNNATVGKTLSLTNTGNEVSLFSNGASIFSGGNDVYVSYLNNLGYTNPNSSYAIITTAKSLFANNVDILFTANTDLIQTNNEIIFHNLTGNTAQFSSNVYVDDLVSNNNIYAGDDATIGKFLYVGIDSYTVGKTVTQNLQSNNTSNTSFLSVTNDSFTNYGQANTRFVSGIVQANTKVFTDTIQANTSINTSIVSVTTNVYCDFINANTNIKTGVVDCTVVGLTDLSGNPLLNSVTSNYGYFKSADVDGSFSVSGTFNVLGSMTYGTNSIRIANNAPVSTWAGIVVNRTKNSNGVVVNPGYIDAEMSWNESTKKWRVANVTSQQYSNVLSYEDVSNNVAETSVAKIASSSVANTINIHANSSYNHANSSYINANSAFTKANSAYNLSISPITIGTTQLYHDGVANSTISGIQTLSVNDIVVNTSTQSLGRTDFKPGTNNVYIWDDDSSNYYKIVTGNRTANYDLNLAAGNTTLVSGTMVPTTTSVSTGTGLTGGGNLSSSRTLSLTGQSLALHNLGTNGIVVRNASGSFVSRSITAAGSGISITNGDGVSGNIGITVNTSEASSPSTIVSRDSSSDISTRTIRTDLANQSTISGALAYRVNNSTDNYVRYCSDTTAIQTWLNVPTRTGGNASGTWGINISGTASTATNQSGGTVSATTGSFTGSLSSTARIIASGSQGTSSLATATGGLGSIEITGQGAAYSAFMAFHRPGAYATYFGLDTNNRFRVGGWSMGATAYNIPYADNPITFYAADIGGTPARVFGSSNDGTAWYEYNPANFSVNYANSAGNADTVDGYHHNQSLLTTSSPSFYGLTVLGLATVEGLTVGTGTSCSITMQDTDEGSRTIHCNSNRIGFLTQNMGWGAWCEDDGSWGSAGNITSYSDIRTKSDIETIADPVEKVKNMRGVYYTKKDTGKRGSGVIAQELFEVAPELVSEDKDGIMSVAYGNIVGYLIEAIKEQQKQIDALNKKIGN